MGKISTLRSYKINQLGNITIPTLISSAGNSQNYVFSTTDDIYFEAEVYLNSYHTEGNAILESTSATYEIVNEFSFKIIGENGEERGLPIGSFGIYNGERGQSLSFYYTDVAIINLNTWTKVTAKRTNGVWSLFINDIACSVSRFEDAGVPNDQFGNIDLPVYIGRSETSDFNFDGQIKNIILGNKLINSKISIKKQNLGGGKISLYKAKPQPKFVVFGVALLGTNLASAPVPCDFSNYNTTWIYFGSPRYRYRKIDELIYITTPLTPEAYGGNGFYQIKDSDDQYFTNSYNNTDKFPSDNWQLGNYITNHCPGYITVPIFVLQNPNAVIFYESGSGNPLTYSGDGLSTSHFVGGLSGGGQDNGGWTVTFKIKKAGVLYYSFDLQSEAYFDYAAANVNNNTIFEYQSGITQSNGNINVNIDDIITISYSKDESVSVGFDGIQFDFYIV
jgi:hypothetical protein